jgi:hypothetical protein
MYAAFTIDKNELNENFLTNLKNFGNSHQLLISVEDYDITETMASDDRRTILERIKYVEEGGELIEVKLEDLEKML